MIKRFFDIAISLILIIVLALFFIFIFMSIKFSSKGPVIFWSDRVGRNNVIFKMPKFRTMIEETPNVATHLLENTDSYLTSIGSFLRKTSLDELPQLFSILKGDMSLVGPRPALFNQDDLIKLRTDLSIDKILPGITGLAQICGRDELSIEAKVQLDLEYLNYMSFWFDLKILIRTFLKIIKRENISH